MTKEKEIWVDSYYYPEKYEVSNYGQIRNKINKKLMHQKTDSYGYKVFRPRINNHRKYIFVHRLVYLSFYPEIDISLDIHHLDHDKTNNHLSNLDKITRKEHCSLHRDIESKRTEKSKSWKERIVAIDPISQKITNIMWGRKDIKSQNFEPNTVYAVVNGKIKKHKNHFFKRIPHGLQVEIGEIFSEKLLTSK